MIFKNSRSLMYFDLLTFLAYDKTVLNLRKKVPNDRFPFILLVLLLKARWKLAGVFKLISIIIIKANIISLNSI